MSEFIYLMRNGDLYKLGRTRNLESEVIKLKPGEILASYEASDPQCFEARLIRLYKRKRIPETSYFRLSEEEVNDCKKHLEGNSNLPKSLNDELKIGFNGSLLFGIITFLITFVFKKMLVFSLFLSIAFASLPMWLLAILGSFGGYDIANISLFSTFSIRVKGFFVAISMSSVAYVLYAFSGFEYNFLN